MHLLSVIIEGCRNISQFYKLTGINKLNGLFAGKEHTERTLNLYDSIFAQVQFFTLSLAVCRGNNSINYIAFLCSDSPIGSDDILGSNDFECCIRQSLYGIYRQVCFTVGLNAAEYFAGLFDIDNTLLRSIREVNHNQSKAVFIHSIIVIYLKADRLIVKNVTIRCLNLNQLIITLVKLFRSNQIAVCGSVESIHLGQGRIGVLHNHTLTVCIVEMECSSCIRNLLTGLAVHLHKFQVGSKRCVVDKVLVNFSVGTDIHCERRHILGILPAGGLAYSITTVRKILGFRKTIRIAHKNIPFTLTSIFITACRSKEDFKGCAFLRCLNLSFTGVRVFDDCNGTHNRFLNNTILCGVVFYRVKLCLGTHVVAGVVKQIALRRTDFL